MNFPVAAVVVRWKGGAEVHRCVGSLGGTREVVVVDNASGDGGAERLAVAFPTVRVEAMTENLGFAGGVNLGVDRTTAPLILILNPDAALMPGALEGLAGHLESSPRLAGVVPALVDGEGHWDHEWQCRSLPTWFDLGLGRSGRPAFGRPPNGPLPVAQPAAAAWLIRREVFEDLGGLDTMFHPAWWEDVDFCARFDASRSWTTMWEVVPEARVAHLGGSSVPSLGSASFLETYHRNLALFAVRHHARRVAAIRSLLRFTLAARGWIRPRRKSDYRAAWSAAEKVLG